MIHPAIDSDSPFLPPVTERHVQAIWYDAALRPETLRTSEGLPLRVVSPGAWNLEAGPDFRDAVLEVGNPPRTLRGDVEIHVRPSDWTAHKHSRDAAYSNVVAHVTWLPGPAPTPRGCVSVCIGNFVRTRLDFSPDEIDLAAYPYCAIPASPRPCSRHFARNPDLLLETLSAAGALRLKGKARRLVALFVRRQDRHQVFYEEMMSAFGYKNNAGAFRALAERLPWKSLPKTAAAAEAALSTAALCGDPRIEWKAGGGRPANSPAKRLPSAAAMFAGTLPGLLLKLSSIDLSTKEGALAARDALCGAGLVGRPRAAAMLANVVTPFALAESRLAAPPEWMCPEGLNSTVRLAAYRLLGRDHNPAVYGGNGLHIQGLIHIHRTLCLAVRPDCSNCPLGEP